MPTQASSNLTPLQKAVQNSALVSTICFPGLPPIQMMLGQEECEDRTFYGVNPVACALADSQLPNLRLLSLMLGLTHPGQLVLDLGAYVGEFTLVAAAAGRRVLAIEASRRNQALILGSIRLNGMGDQVELVCAAVSNRRGELFFREAGPFGTVVGPGEEAAVATPAVPVGELLAARQESVGFIKIDVEGYELEAFQGMADWLTCTAEAPPILYESHVLGQQERGRSVRELRRYLVGLGYIHHYLIHRDGVLTPMDLDEAQPLVVGECLATRGPVTAPAGWRVGPVLSDKDFIRLFRQDAAVYWDKPHLLASLGIELASAQGSLTKAPRVKVHLSRAARHWDVKVCEVFALWKDCGGLMREAAELLRIRSGKAAERVARELPRLHTMPARLLQKLTGWNPNKRWQNETQVARCGRST